jgi:hypothetical protein
MNWRCDSSVVSTFQVKTSVRGGRRKEEEEGGGGGEKK